MKCEKSEMIWQTMGFSFFQPKLSAGMPWLTLKQLKSYRETDETRQYKKIIKGLIDKEVSYLRPDLLTKFHNSLEHSFKKIDSITYISCFYHRCRPSANLLKEFGGDHGVSVGFDKGIVEGAIEKFEREHLTYGNVPSSRLWYNDIGYISGEKKHFDDKVNRFSSGINIAGDDIVRYNILYLRDLVIEYLPLDNIFTHIQCYCK